MLDDDMILKQKITIFFYAKGLGIVCLGFGILLSGCVSDPGAARNYYFPPVYEDLKSGSNLFSTTGAPVQNIAQTATKKSEDILKKSEWTLQDCVDLAVINEEQLKIQGESYYQTKWLYRQAVSNWLPFLSLQDSRTSSYNNQLFSNEGNLHSSQTSLHLRQPIYNGGQEVAGLTNAGLQAELQKYKLKQYRDVLVLAVANAFYQMIELKNELAALETLQDYTKNYYDMVKAREEAQVAQHKDTLLAEATLFDIQAQIVRTKNSFNNARLDLQRLVGATLPQNFIDELSVSEIPKELTDVMTTTLENRPDLKIADRQIQLAETDVTSAKTGYLPDVNLDLTRYLNTTGASVPPPDWSAVLSLTLPLDNGGKNAQLEQAYSRLRQAGLEKDKLLKNTRNDVEQTYRNLQAIKSDIEAREKGLAAAKETADIILEQYGAGTATNIEVLFTKNTYEQAKINLDKSQIDLKLAYLQLKFNMGILSKDF